MIEQRKPFSQSNGNRAPGAQRAQRVPACQAARQSKTVTDVLYLKSAQPNDGIRSLAQNYNFDRARATQASVQKKDRIQVVFVGEKNVGKTTFIEAYQEQQQGIIPNQFCQPKRATIGVDLRQIVYRKPLLKEQKIHKGNNLLNDDLLNKKQIKLVSSDDNTCDQRTDQALASSAFKKSKTQNLNTRKNSTNQVNEFTPIECAITEGNLSAADFNNGTQFSEKKQKRKSLFKFKNGKKDQNEARIRMKNASNFGESQMLDYTISHQNQTYNLNKENQKDTKFGNDSMMASTMNQPFVSQKQGATGNAQGLGKSVQSTDASDDSLSKKKQIDFTEHKINLWDTQGMERCHSIPASQIKKADAIVLLYDLTDMKTFTVLHDWLNKIEDIAKAHAPVILIGNKSDLKNDIIISEKDQSDLEKGRSIKGFRLSAQEDDDNVRQCLQYVFDEAINAKEQAKMQRNFVYKKEYQKANLLSQAALEIKTITHDNNFDLDNDSGEEIDQASQIIQQQIAKMKSNSSKYEYEGDPIRTSIKLSVRDHSFKGAQKKKKKCC